MTRTPSRGDQLHVHVEADRDWILLTLAGELDIAGVPVLADQVAQLRAVGFASFRVDLRQLGFMDSAGLHFLADLARTEALSLQIITGPGAVERLLDLSGMRRMLPLVVPSHGRLVPAASGVMSGGVAP